MNHSEIARAVWELCGQEGISLTDDLTQVDLTQVEEAIETVVRRIGAPARRAALRAP